MIQVPLSSGLYKSHVQKCKITLPSSKSKYMPQVENISRLPEVLFSQGWVHYMIHEPEPHVSLFRGRCSSRQRNEAGGPLSSLTLNTAVLTC
uniref:Cyclin-dependent kinases regulatory subunit n=1 Tax=Ursus maritimus TaxID=29073 RepID=A0A452UMV8_URSMA